MFIALQEGGPCVFLNGDGRGSHVIFELHGSVFPLGAAQLSVDFALDITMTVDTAAACCSQKMGMYNDKQLMEMEVCRLQTRLRDRIKFQSNNVHVQEHTTCGGRIGCRQERWSKRHSQRWYVVLPAIPRTVLWPANVNCLPIIR